MSSSARRSHRRTSAADAHRRTPSGRAGDDRSGARTSARRRAAHRRAEQQQSYRSALRHRDFRLVVTALLISATGSWAYNVALVAYVYARTHSAGWVTAAALARFLPTLIFSPYAGLLAERLERVRLLLTADLISTALMTGLAAAMATHAPTVVVVTLAGLTALTTTIYPTATGATTPQLVGEDDLAAANALQGAIENLVVLVGPAIGAALLLVGPPPVVVALNAASFAGSALIMSRVRTRTTPTDVAGEGGIGKQLGAGVAAIAGSSTAALLVAFSVVASFLYGTDTVLFAVLSRTQLGTGASGYGYLLAGLGVGGLLAATVINRVAGTSRLGLLISVTMLLYCLPTAALVAIHSAGVAFAMEVIRGFGTFFLDTLAMTALQRSLQPDVIGRVFGVFFAFILGGISLGALVVPPLLGLTGLHGTLLILGLGVSGLVLLVTPRLLAMDTAARGRLARLAPRVTVLEGLGIFAAASRATLERLAAGATEQQAAAGLTLITEGDPPDALYVLVDGRVEVRALAGRERPAVLAHLDAPAYFGEIGLLEHIPRTATAQAVEACSLYRIEGEDFLSALAEARPSAALAEVVAGRLAATRPSQPARGVAGPGTPGTPGPA